MPTSRSRKSKSIDYKERVEVDEDDDVVMVERPKSSKKPVAVDTAEDDEDEDEDDDEEEEEDDELGDGEYIVEKILNHRVDKVSEAKAVAPAFLRVSLMAVPLGRDPLQRKVGGLRGSEGSYMGARRESTVCGGSPLREKVATIV